MTRNTVLVEREYDGEERGECRRVFLAGKVGCELFHDEIKGNLRCPACLATPPARVLTPEMVEAVEGADILAYYIDNPSAWEHFDQYLSDVIAEHVTRLRAAFGIEEATK